MGDNVKACPFCGGVSSSDKYAPNMAYCVDGLSGADNEDKKCYNDAILSIEDWNTRPLEDDLRAELKNTRELLTVALADIERLRKWVDDLHSGMYINCVYCGHRYGPNDEVPASMADVLKEHIEQCPEHPMSKLKMENERITAKLAYIESFVEDQHLSVDETYAQIFRFLKGGE